VLRLKLNVLFFVRQAGTDTIGIYMCIFFTIFARMPPLASVASCGPHLPRYASVYNAAMLLALWRGLRGYPSVVLLAHPALVT